MQSNVKSITQFWKYVKLLPRSKILQYNAHSNKSFSECERYIISSLILISINYFSVVQYQNLINCLTKNIFLNSMYRFPELIPIPTYLSEMEYNYKKNLINSSFSKISKEKKADIFGFYYRFHHSSF